MNRNVLCLHLSQGNECREKNVGTILCSYKVPVPKKIKPFFFFFWSPHILITSLTFAPAFSSLAPPLQKHTDSVSTSKSQYFSYDISQIPLPPTILLLHPFFMLPSSPAWVVQRAPSWVPCFFAYVPSTCYPPKSINFQKT